MHLSIKTFSFSGCDGGRHWGPRFDFHVLHVALAALATAVEHTGPGEHAATVTHVENFGGHVCAACV